MRRARCTAYGLGARDYLWLCLACYAYGLCEVYISDRTAEYALVSEF